MVLSCTFFYFVVGHIGDPSKGRKPSYKFGKYKNKDLAMWYLQHHFWILEEWDSGRYVYRYNLCTRDYSWWNILANDSWQSLRCGPWKSCRSQKLQLACNLFLTFVRNVESPELTLICQFPKTGLSSVHGNKADLAYFLLNHLFVDAPVGKTELLLESNGKERYKHQNLF